MQVPISHKYLTMTSNLEPATLPMIIISKPHQLRSLTEGKQFPTSYDARSTRHFEITSQRMRVST